MMGAPLGLWLPTLYRWLQYMLLAYDCCILPFVYDKVNERNEYDSGREEEDGLEEDRGSYKCSMYSFTQTASNVLSFKFV